MAENRYINEQGESRGAGFIRSLEKAVGMKKLEEAGIPIKHFPKILFVFILLLFYIWNTHNTEKAIRKISRLEKEVEDLRADYTTLKAEYMLSGKQSEVAKKVNKIGVAETLTPPYKIVVKD